MTIPKAALRGFSGYQNGVLNVGIDYAAQFELMANPEYVDDVTTPDEEEMISDPSKPV